MKKKSENEIYRQERAVTLKKLRGMQNGRIRALGYQQAIRETEQYEAAKDELVFFRKLDWVHVGVKAAVVKLKDEIKTFKKHPTLGHIFKKLRIGSHELQGDLTIEERLWLSTSDSSQFNNKKLTLEDFHLIWDFRDQLPKLIRCIIIYPRNRPHAAKMWREKGVWKVDEDFNNAWAF